MLQSSSHILVLSDRETQMDMTVPIYTVGKIMIDSIDAQCQAHSFFSTLSHECFELRFLQTLIKEGYAEKPEAWKSP